MVPRPMGEQLRASVLDAAVDDAKALEATLGQSDRHKLDEYLTGEHDKMVKYAWRFLSPDEMVLEVHDLHIGEQDTMVLETRYRRVQ